MMKIPTCLAPQGFETLGLPTILLGFSTDAAGVWRLGPLTVPNVPGNKGLLLAAQAGVGPTATLPLATDLTNGLPG